MKQIPLRRARTQHDPAAPQHTDRVEVRPRNIPRCRADDGAALLELALVLPFVAVVVFGTIDLGRGLALRNRVTNMAREGAFYAQFHPADVTGCSPTSISGVAKSGSPH